MGAIMGMRMVDLESDRDFFFPSDFSSSFYYCFFCSPPTPLPAIPPRVVVDRISQCCCCPISHIAITSNTDVTNNDDILNITDGNKDSYSEYDNQSLTSTAAIKPYGFSIDIIIIIAGRVREDIVTGRRRGTEIFLALPKPRNIVFHS